MQAYYAPEPRWPAWLATVAIAAILRTLPSALIVGPDWLVFVLMIALTTVGSIVHARGKLLAAQNIGYAALSIATLAMVASLATLIYRLPTHAESPRELLLAATALWSSNILIFACWYWRLDAGGPRHRDLRESHTDGAFLFPQMTISVKMRQELQEVQWRPTFIDYLFIAFNTSTAFSPTDAPVLSPWAKILMMIQSSVSLTTLAILAARAVNIL